MKRIQQIVPTLLIILLTSPIVWAQNFDANRMNRDIKIMENILGEMFKTYNKTNQNARGSFSFGNINGSDNVRGTYLPGFGIIFNVKHSTGLIIMESASNSSSMQSFYYSSESSPDKDPEVNEETIQDRIVEFLKDYASTIGQLKPNENVMVIYGSKPSHSFPALVVRSTNDKTEVKEKREKLPIISGSVTKKDLDDYRSGKINDANFAKRVKTASTKDKEYLDLKVMSNIFETALKDQDEESFRLSGNVNYLLLDNFGAIFNLDVSYRTNNHLFGTVSGISVSGSYVRTNTLNSEDFLAAEREKAEFLIKVNDAYASLKNNLKEYLVDYGRTISSVKPEQYILTTVNIRGRYKDIPERIDVQLKKSVLDQLDRGSISREKALEQVVITEY